MKKLFIKFLCLGCSVTILLTSCQTTSKINKNDFDIESEEYVVSINMVGGYAGNHYTFVLTPDNRILAEYSSGSTGTKQVQIKLNKQQIALMEEHLNKVLSLKEEDIEGYLGISDYWYCTISYNDVCATFHYGASESLSVNILLEQILGCCDSEKSLKTAKFLQGAPVTYREMMAFFATIEEEEE